MIGDPFLDLRLANDLAVALGVDERQLLGRLCLDDSREDAAVGGGDDRRPVAFDDLARGIEHRLDQQGALVLAADVGEIRSDVAAFAA